MCIRDRELKAGKILGLSLAYCDNDHPEKNPKVRDNMYGSCLLYTSDAADERSSVDLGGRRIIKKKNKD